MMMAFQNDPSLAHCFPTDQSESILIKVLVTPLFNYNKQFIG